MRIMGRLSVGLLVCVLLGQGMWLFRVREMNLLIVKIYTQ